MNLNKYKNKAAAVVLTAAVFSNSCAVFGAGYTDVPANHWAYSAIMNMAGQGIMVGDSAGSFNPNLAVDKFYTAKVLAKAAGFQYVNLTSAEKKYIDDAYDKNKALLEQFGSAFTKWDSTADREIAYLLEKGIFVPTDLNQFVVRLADGTEKLRALSREEYCVFLVRLMGRTNEAASFSYSGTKFSDDASITEACKPYVYYLKSKNVVTGDSFSPKGAVTKAAMAVMTDKALTVLKGTSAAQDQTDAKKPTPLPAPTPNTGGNVTTIRNISGTLSKVYPGMNAVQVSMSNGLLSTYKFAASSTVYVNGLVKTMNDLKEGMQVSMIVSDSLITELKAVANTQSGGGQVFTPTEPAKAARAEGKIAALSANGTGMEITIKIPSIDAREMVSYTENTYQADGACVIKRDGVTTTFSDMVVGEVIFATVSGNKITAIDLERKDITLSGAKLLKKRFDSYQNKAVLTVADESGNEREFIITKDSEISREGIGICGFDALRIGDTVELSAVFSDITKIHAVGKRTAETGWLDEIIISNNVSYLKVREEKSDTSRVRLYPVVNEEVDLYGLRLDSKVKIKLDSEEVEAVTVLEEATSKSGRMSGYIYMAKSGYVAVVADLGRDDFTKLYIDGDTNVVDAVRGHAVDVDDLEEGMEVYVTIRTENGEKYAKTITILDYSE